MFVGTQDKELENRPVLVKQMTCSQPVQRTPATRGHMTPTYLTYFPLSRGMDKEKEPGINDISDIIH